MRTITTKEKNMALSDEIVDRLMGDGVPSVEEIKTALNKMLDKIEIEKLWVNPDCGLKTRGNEETTASLKNLVAAAKELREVKDF